MPLLRCELACGSGGRGESDEFVFGENAWMLRVGVECRNQRCSFTHDPNPRRVAGTAVIVIFSSSPCCRLSARSVRCRDKGSPVPADPDGAPRPCSDSRQCGLQWHHRTALRTDSILSIQSQIMYRRFFHRMPRHAGFLSSMKKEISHISTKTAIPIPNNEAGHCFKTGSDPLEDAISPPELRCPERV